MEEMEKCPDVLDQASLMIERTIDAGIAAAMRKAADIPPGNPGECDTCGEFSGRLVNGMCSPCRDKYKVD